jgi:hypothetical protein
MKTLLFFALLSSGCALTPRVITTEISQTDTGFKIVSPKDTTISYFSTPGGYTWFGYTAKASPDALNASVEESNKRAESIAKLAEAAAALK